MDMKPTSRKVLFSLPEELLGEIDAVAAEEHRSRSELIREAARRYIAERSGGRRPIDDPAVREAVRSMDHIAEKIHGSWNSARVVRDMRNGRHGPSQSKTGKD